MPAYRHPEMSRRLATLIGAAGLTFALTGCGGDSPAVPAPGGPSASTPPPPAPTPTPEPPPVVLNEVSQGISTTPENQIVVELQPDDATTPNLFDLDGRTLTFTPDANGGYSRSVGPLAWEDDIGRPVEDGAEIPLQGFEFAFAGRSWDSFFVSRHGALTFEERLAYDPIWSGFSAISRIASDFAATPTISALYKPLLGGWDWNAPQTRQYVVHAPDRVVVTWFPTEPEYHIHGRTPTQPSRFQLVLRADGGIRFNYENIAWSDGIVGLFPLDVTRGDVITGLADERDPALPGYLDILDVSIYESNTDGVVAEFTLRDDVPVPPDGERYSYSLYFDTDEPYWSEPLDWSDLDLVWGITVYSTERPAPRGRGVRVLAGSANDRIALLAPLPADTREFSAVAATSHFTNGESLVADESPVTFLRIDPPPAPPTAVDLSRAGDQGPAWQYEVFDYPRLDSRSIVCRVLEVLGDEFDLVTLHSEFRLDSQRSSTPWVRYGNNVDAEGIGSPGKFSVPCGSSRLKGRYRLSIWMKSAYVWNRTGPSEYAWNQGAQLFAHELTHTWSAYASYLDGGVRVRLYADSCRCHWRPDFHLEAAFPWPRDASGQGATMGGRYWRENADGTFTPQNRPNAGLSWLDLYMMGLAEAREVPDMFILRNLRPLNGPRFSSGPHAADKEIVTIEQIIAADGPRIPSPASSQKDFNAAFVYLVEPGQTPDAAMLDLHREHRDQVLEYWAHTTGGRSRITTRLPGAANHPR